MLGGLLFIHSYNSPTATYSVDTIQNLSLVKGKKIFERC